MRVVPAPHAAREPPGEGSLLYPRDRRVAMFLVIFSPFYLLLALQEGLLSAQGV
jgi:hypothetical protein